jgi:hypothetical protein
MATKESQFLTPVAAQVVDELHASTGLPKKLIMSAGVLAFQEQFAQGDSHNLTRAMLENVANLEKEAFLLLKSLRRDQQELAFRKIGFMGQSIIAALSHETPAPPGAETYKQGNDLVEKIAETQAEPAHPASHKGRTRGKGATGS